MHAYFGARAHLTQELLSDPCWPKIRILVLGIRARAWNLPCSVYFLVGSITGEKSVSKFGHVFFSISFLSPLQAKGARGGVFANTNGKIRKLQDLLTRAGSTEGSAQM